MEPEEGAEQLMRARFRALVIEWDLGRNEVAGLLGTESAMLGLDLVPLYRDGPVETRLRLLLEIRLMLPLIFRDERNVQLWLREHGHDDQVPCATPLQFLSGSLENVQAFCRALRRRVG
jgi:hypothetical protein